VRRSVNRQFDPEFSRCVLKCGRGASAVAVHRLGGHSRPVTEDEAKTVAALAAHCVWGARSRWGRSCGMADCSPGTDVGAGNPMIPAWACKNAYRRAMDSALLYTEGYACRPSGVTNYPAWCLDGETVVDPGFSEPGTAYFGVPLRPDYVRRTREAQRTDDGNDGFRYVFMDLHEEISPSDPCACQCHTAVERADIAASHIAIILPSKILLFMGVS